MTLKDFPEIRGINYGICPGSGTHYSPVSPWNAHTHLCSRDPYYLNICAYSEEFLFKDGKPTKILWHEYAHVLDAQNYADYVKSCNNRGMHQYEFTGDDQIKKASGMGYDGHGKSWERIMVEFGQQPTRFVIKEPA